MTTRVLVVDDHELFREGVVATLRAEEDFDLVGEAGSSEEALAAARTLRPDVILLDVYMPGDEGLTIIPTLRNELPDTLVVMLTVSEDPDTVMGALRRGASGYLVKGVRAEVFLEALRAIVQGETYVSPEVAGRILAAVNQDAQAKSPDSSDLASLTRREREVLELLARGNTNREIADALVLSEKTVKRHVTGILAKLHVRNRTEAALRAASDAEDRDSST